MVLTLRKKSRVSDAWLYLDIDDRTQKVLSGVVARDRQHGYSSNILSAEEAELAAQAMLGDCWRQELKAG